MTGKLRAAVRSWLDAPDSSGANCLGEARRVLVSLVDGVRGPDPAKRHAAVSASRIKAAFAGAALFASLSPSLAAARYAGDPYDRQSASQRDSGQPTPGFNPHEGLQPNGCVKLCEFDDTPCDPPAFKHADGRCAYQP